MTREEFKQKYKEGVLHKDFPVWDWRDGCLSMEDLDDFAQLAVTLAEPLFEEIERLKEVGRIHQKKISELVEEQEQLNEQWLKTYHDVEARAVYHEAATATMKIQIESLDEKNEDLENRLFVKTQRAENDEFIIQTASDRIELLQKVLKDKNTYIEALEQDVVYLKDSKDAIFEQLRLDQDRLLDATEQIKRFEEALTFYNNKHNLEKYIWEKLHHKSDGESYISSGLMDGVTKVAENALNPERLVTPD